MTEKLLQFIWQFQYFNRSELHTVEGEPVEILFPGRLNTHQGPDFSDAKIRVGTTLLAGSVELHLRTSDWQRHKHGQDKSYRNVIVHVVLQHDQLFQNPIPVLELQHRIPSLLLENYTALMNALSFIPCASTIKHTRELTWINWKERLVAERLTRKAATVLEGLEQTGGHWEETFWRLLARNFGIKVNADAFEELARSLPVNLLARQRASIHQLEALLLGQANLLPEPADDYTRLLLREYNFLKLKYELAPINTPMHFLRMRPGNFPTVRLAQLAMLIHSATHLFSDLLEEQDAEKAKAKLQVTANDYWHYHYRPGQLSPYKLKKLGEDMAENIIINTLVPVLFAYGTYHHLEAYKEKAVHWLQQTAAESNTISKGFKTLSVSSKSAFDTQALLELKHGYCDAKRCLDCAVGNFLLKGFAS
jgi:hypothetical protein